MAPPVIPTAAIMCRRPEAGEDRDSLAERGAEIRSCRRCSCSVVISGDSLTMIEGEPPPPAVEWEIVCNPCALASATKATKVRAIAPEHEAFARRLQNIIRRPQG